MYSKTIDHLEKSDNQHDFERMCADILNALGYRDVVLIAPLERFIYAQNLMCKCRLMRLFRVFQQPG
jgi:hypothetical protein